MWIAIGIVITLLTLGGLFWFVGLYEKYDRHNWSGRDWYIRDRYTGKLTRIPDDVRKRAEKAGATKPPDWYVGR